MESMKWAGSIWKTMGLRVKNFQLKNAVMKCRLLHHLRHPLRSVKRRRKRRSASDTNGFSH